MAGYGMLAAEELEAGEVLCTVPRSALLSQHTCSIQALLREGEHRLGAAGLLCRCLLPTVGLGVRLGLLEQGTSAPPLLTKGA